jgi:hypothetical protein
MIVLSDGTKAPITGDIIPIYFRHGIISVGIANVLGLPTLFVANSSKNGQMSPPEGWLKRECVACLRDYLANNKTLTALLEEYPMFPVRREIEASGAIFTLNGVLTLRVGFEEEEIEHEDD